MSKLHLLRAGAWHSRLADAGLLLQQSPHSKAVCNLRLCRPCDQVLGGWAHLCRMQAPARPAAAPRARRAPPPAPQSAPAPAPTSMSTRAHKSSARQDAALAGHERDEAAADHAARAAAASHSLLIHSVATLARPHSGGDPLLPRGRRLHLTLQALLVGLALVVGAHRGSTVALAPARTAPVAVPIQAKLQTGGCLQPALFTAAVSIPQRVKLKV